MKRRRNIIGNAANKAKLPQKEFKLKLSDKSKNKSEQFFKSMSLQGWEIEK